MKFLTDHWEKLILAGVALLLLLALALHLTGGGSHRTFTASGEAVTLGSNVYLADYATVIARAGTNAPAVLEPDRMDHSYLQFCSQCKKLQPKWSVKCPECEAVVNYPEDEDKDGMPNLWEREHGLDWTNPADANEDPDKDGFTNLEEYKWAKGSTDPHNPADPNVVAEEYALNDVYKPVRPVMFKNWNKPAVGNRYYIYYKGHGGTPYKDGDVVKDGTTVVYRIEKFVEKTTNFTFGSMKLQKTLDLSQLTLRDVKRDESFTAVIGQSNYMTYSEVKITRRKDNVATNLAVGAEIEVESLKKTATLTAIDDQERKCVFTVGAIRYPVALEK